MSARAVWRRNPEDPRTDLGWALPEGERALGRLRSDLGCFGTIAAVWLLFLGHPLAAAALFLLPALLRLLARRRRSVEPLLTLPLAAPTFPCAIDVRREGATVGVDRGVVTFIDGWLHFEGFRTTFSLSRADVRQRDRNALTFENGGEIEFHPDESLHLPALGVERIRAVQAFDEDLDRWVRLEPAAQGISVLPPLALHPSGVARARTDLAYALLKNGLVLAAILYALSVSHGPGFYVFFVSGFTGGLIDAVRQFRRVRRFAREDRPPLPNDPNPSLGR